MAAPKSIKDYLGKKLNLPHTYWGADAKAHYPDNWKTGSQLVTLSQYRKAQNGDEESLVFKADDDDEYLITLTSLKTYWARKLFLEQRTFVSVPLLAFLCCVCRISACLAS
jgi:hypothetical protein